MNAISIINKVREKEKLTKEELNYMIMGYVNEEIKDYQMSSFLMAICLNGLTMDEIYDMTDIMIHSGEVIDLSFLGENTVDKHSTGGVGDKTTLILAPLVASCSVNVFKMSGRGLGFTGGTIDKLESISGFKTSMSNEEFKSQIKDIKVGIVGGNKDLVIADKKIYALRDVTGTVSSIPLIASSIMSKKIAAGNKKIVIDLKVGNGALMKDEKSARELARTMIDIGKRYDVKVVCVLSKMDEPLGCAIGNSLEVIEALEVLKGHYTSDMFELIECLGSQMLMMGLNITKEEAKEKLKASLINGLGLKKFEEMVKYQNGDITKIPVSSKYIEIKSKKTGYIKNIDALKLANISMNLGSGRVSLDDKIDHSVGIWLYKKSGFQVNENDTLARVYYNLKEVNVDEVLSCFDIVEHKVDSSSIIVDVIS